MTTFRDLHPRRLRVASATMRNGGGRSVKKCRKADETPFRVPVGLPKLPRAV